MGYSNGVISAPVNTDDVCTALGVSKHEVGYLCSNAHLKINPFAKFKPTRYDNVDSVDGYWKGLDGNCGFAPYQLSSIADIVNHCDGTLNGWEYLAPNGSYWKRLTDFVGYKHNAVRPLQNGLIVPDHVYSDGTISIGFPWMTGSDTIGFEDIAITKNTYWAFFFIKEVSGTKVHGTTTTQTASEEGGIIDIDVSSLPNPIGTWKLYPCLSTVSYKVTDGYPTSTYYTIPYVSPVTIVIESSANKVTMSVKITRIMEDGANITLTVKNNTSGAITFKNNSWQARYKGFSESSSIVTGEALGSIADFSLNSGASKDISIQIRKADCISSGAELLILLQSGAYKYRCEITKHQIAT